MKAWKKKFAEGQAHIHQKKGKKKWQGKRRRHCAGDASGSERRGEESCGVHAKPATHLKTKKRRGV